MFIIQRILSYVKKLSYRQSTIEMNYRLNLILSLSVGMPLTTFSQNRFRITKPLIHYIKVEYNSETPAANLTSKFLQIIILEKHFLVLYSYDILMEENQTCWNLNKIYGEMWPLG